jgi:hypothetical protein
MLVDERGKYLLVPVTRGCVAMERLRGEPVGFQSFRTRVF